MRWRWWQCSVVVMVLVCRQRRILRIVAFIGVACVIFLCFQLFLVGFLDHSAHLGLQHGAQPKFGLDSDDLRVIDITDERMKTTERPLQLQHRVESECTSRNCSIAAKLLKTSVLAISESHVISNASRLPGSFVSNDSHKDSSSELSQFRSVWEFLEHRFSRPFVLEKGISAHFTRGVNSRWQYLYEADDRMQFTCILSQVRQHIRFHLGSPRKTLIHCYECHLVKCLWKFTNIYGIIFSLVTRR